MILITITIPFLVTVLFLTGIPANGLRGVNFKTYSNSIALKLMVDSFILSLLLIGSPFKQWSCYLVQISGCTLLSLLNCVCFPRAYIILPFDLTNVISLFTWLWKPIFLEISRNCRWVHQPPPHPLLGLMMNSCFGTCFHSSFPENLTMSSHQFVLHFSSQTSWVWGILTPIRSEPQSDMMVGTYFQEL